MPDKVKILIVDDEESINNEIATFFRNHGYSTISCFSGESGLKELQQHSDIDLVISDLNMGAMSGLDMIESAQAILGKIPKVIILTTENSKDKIERGKQLGVIAWRIKPFNGNTFIKYIDKLLAY